MKNSSLLTLRPLLNLVRSPYAYIIYTPFLIFAALLLFFHFIPSNASILIPSLIYSHLLSFPVFVHFYLFARFFNRKKYLVYSFALFLIIAIPGYLSYLILLHLFKFSIYLSTPFFHIIVLLIISTAVKFLENDLRRRWEAQRTETRRLEKKLDTLKSDIGHRFILEKLTQLHNISIEDPEKLPPMILEYSEKMRELLKKPALFLAEKEEIRNEKKGFKFVFDWIYKVSSFNRQVVLYLLAWSIFALFIFLPSQTNPVSISQRFITFCYYFALSLPTYFHFLILDRLYRRRIRYLIITTAMIILSTEVFYILFARFLQHTVPFSQWIISITSAVVVTAALRFVKNRIKQGARAQEIKTRHLESELNLLKSQVNPHFLFNTLNNLYSLSLDQSQKLPPMIKKLKDLMEYMLESSTDEYVSLESEKNFIENYLSLERLRFPSGCAIQMVVNGNLKGQKIAPMLLISFVENSFKHGVSTSLRDFYVLIHIHVSDSYFVFTVRNSLPSINARPKSPRSGLGLQNVRRRLQLLYPNRHDLKIEKSSDAFNITLEIRL